jgi:hypothetical protein
VACTRGTSAVVPWVRVGDLLAHNVQDREPKGLMISVPRDMDLWIRYFQHLPGGLFINFVTQRWEGRVWLGVMPGQKG